MALSKVDLDLLTAKGCQVPGCDCGRKGELYLHQKCCPGGGLEVSYQHGSGELIVSCMKCRSRVAAIMVGGGLDYTSEVCTMTEGNK